METVRTIDHDEIREWVEERGGAPAIVEGTRGEGGGILRVDFGENLEELEDVSWEEFFRIFEDNDLAFVYQSETYDGSESFVCKFAARHEDEEETEEGDVGWVDEAF